VDAVLAAHVSGATPEVPPSAQSLVEELTLRGPRRRAAPTSTGGIAGTDEPVIVLPPDRPVEELANIHRALSPGEVGTGNR